MRSSQSYWGRGTDFIPDQYVDMLNAVNFPVPYIWNDYQVLGSTFNITETNNTFQDTGLSVTLPDWGIYLVYADVRAEIDVETNPPGHIKAKFYNSTLGADVTNSERLVLWARQETGSYQGGCSMQVRVSVTGACVIKLYVAKNGSSTTWTTSAINSSSAGRTVMGFARLR